MYIHYIFGFYPIFHNMTSLLMLSCFWWFHRCLVSTLQCYYINISIYRIYVEFINIYYKIKRLLYLFCSPHWFSLLLTQLCQMLFDDFNRHIFFLLARSFSTLKWMCFLKNINHINLFSFHLNIILLIIICLSIFLQHWVYDLCYFNKWCVFWYIS